MLFHSIPGDINHPVLFAALTAEHSKRSLKLTKAEALLINIIGVGSVLQSSASILRQGWLSSKSHAAYGTAENTAELYWYECGEGASVLCVQWDHAVVLWKANPQFLPSTATDPPGTAAFCVSSAGTPVPCSLFGSLRA